MKNLKTKLTLLMIPIVLIGFGFKANSQTNNKYLITAYQLKQIRLSANRATFDSLNLIQKQHETDTLYRIIKYQRIRLTNADTIQILHVEKIDLLKKLTENGNNQLQVCKTEKNTLFRKIRNRNYLIITSAILNTVFILKSLK